MDKNYLLISLDDERSKNISEVLGSKSCKKILDLLAEKEMSETDIARTLEIPLNTAEYNIKKLLSSGLIEKAKHWWSVKGRKIEMYKLSNKYIVISPKSKPSSKIRTIIPALILSGIFAFIIYIYQKSQQVLPVLKSEEYSAPLMSAAGSVSDASTCGVATNVVNVATSFVQSVSPAVWFLGGAVIAIILILVLNWRKL